jgi:hypothetical protein
MEQRYAYPITPGKDKTPQKFQTPTHTPASPSTLSELKKDALIRDLRKQVLELMKYKEHVYNLKHQVNALEDRDKQMSETSIARNGR